MQNKRLFSVLLLLGAASCTTAPTPIARPVAPPPPAAVSQLSAIHQNLAPMESLWHLRSGFNVAALACQNRYGRVIVDDYNRFQADHKALLKAAYAQRSATFQAEGGKWQAAYDTHMTRLYNWFAMPTAQPDFCIIAARLLKDANQWPAEGLERRAVAALAELDVPFARPRMAIAPRPAPAYAAMKPRPGS